MLELPGLLDPCSVLETHLFCGQNVKGQDYRSQKNIVAWVFALDGNVIHGKNISQTVMQYLLTDFEFVFAG